MNIEIANRLQKLRKENGYSQEELADKLGLSRQAVSKWERAESSPDTDNLIMLARLYNISLDELLNTEENTDEIKTRVEESNDEKKIVVDDDGSYITIENGKPRFFDEDGEEHHFKPNPIKAGIDFVIIIGIVIAYLWVSFKTNAWDITWIVFLFIPILVTVTHIIFVEHRLGHFAYPILVTAIYCYFGMTKGLWHPLWVLYLSIPVYYCIAGLFDTYVFKTSHNLKENKKKDCCK